MNNFTNDSIQITFSQPNLDLFQIADSGQCFRMIPLESEKNGDTKEIPGFSVICSGRYCELYQKGEKITLLCMPQDKTFWKNYLDIDTDYSTIIASVDPSDKYLLKAADFGKGIRILRQDLWEMIITFIISQQKAIPQIRQAVEDLCRSYGTATVNFRNHTYYSFPDPYQLSRASLEELKKHRLGYRAKYIYQVCQDAAGKHMNLDALKSMPYRQAMDYLMQFYGIGEKVANCICLFGLHHVNAFPVDTWIKKILMKEYWQDTYKDLPKNRLYTTMVHDHFSMYEDCAGVMQQYIFFYERRGNMSHLF